MIPLAWRRAVLDYQIELIRETCMRRGQSQKDADEVVGTCLKEFREGDFVRFLARKSASLRNPPPAMIAIAKNATEDIRVTWVELEGRCYMDVRIYTAIEGKADRLPTRKGITLRPDQAPDLIEALQKEGKETLAAMAKKASSCGRA